MSRVRRVLVLGATGFIGSRVLNLLRARKDIQIMALAHRRVDYRALEDIDLLVGDLAHFDLSSIARFEPDTIIHLARMRGRGRTGRSLASRRGRRANVRLIRWLSAHAPATRVIYVSGTLVYGDHGDREVDESTPINPIAFAREYVRAEEPWMGAPAQSRLPVTIVRPPWIVGPGSWFHNYYVVRAQQEGAVPLYGSGSNWMSLIDVEDCAGLIMHIADLPKPIPVCNLCVPGQVIRQAEFVRKIAELMGLGVREVGMTGGRSRLGAAAWEALTFSLRAATVNDRLLSSYQFMAPAWQEMIARNLGIEAPR